MWTCLRPRSRSFTTLCACSTTSDRDVSNIQAALGARGQVHRRVFGTSKILHIVTQYTPAGDFTNSYQPCLYLRDSTAFALSFCAPMRIIIALTALRWRWRSMLCPWTKIKVASAWKVRAVHCQLDRRVLLWRRAQWSWPTSFVLCYFCTLFHEENPALHCFFFVCILYRNLVFIHVCMCVFVRERKLHWVFTVTVHIFLSWSAPNFTVV